MQEPATTEITHTQSRYFLYSVVTVEAFVTLTGRLCSRAVSVSNNTHRTTTGLGEISSSRRRDMCRQERGWGLSKVAKAIRGMHGGSAVCETPDTGANDTVDEEAMPLEDLQDPGERVSRCP